ncbi:MAG: hypothetical protein WC619_03355 [Patescibacteria group bacterium]
MSKKLLTIVLAVLILGLAGGGYLWRANKKPAPSAGEKVVATIQDTAASINESAAGGVLPDISTAMVNPMEDVPDVNPYRNTNPFLNIKINPFK